MQNFDSENVGDDLCVVPFLLLRFDSRIAFMLLSVQYYLNNSGRDTSIPPFQS